jgi:hypothetical protein
MEIGRCSGTAGEQRCQRDVLHGLTRLVDDGTVPGHRVQLPVMAVGPIEIGDRESRATRGVLVDCLAVLLGLVDDVGPVPFV